MTKTYTVQELAQLAGISGRTLRHYDQIGLLSPSSYSKSGYRLYGTQEVDLLQHILLYREMEISLKDIKALIHAPGFQRVESLERHRTELKKRLRRLQKILNTVELSITHEKEDAQMSDEDKFKGFIEETIETNEKQYGREARDTWGDTAVDYSNAKLRKLSKAQYAEFEVLSARVLETLGEAMDGAKPNSDKALECAQLHRQFLEFWWSEYSPQAHWSMVEMYVQDDRFKSYYEKVRTGAAQFLRDTVAVYLEKEFDFRG